MTYLMQNPVLTLLSLALPGLAFTTTALSTPLDAEPSRVAIVNSGFESGSLEGWTGWRTRRAATSDDACSGSFAVVLGPEIGQCSQELSIRPNSQYRLSAWVKTETGAEEVQLIASDYGGPAVSVSSALTEYAEVSLTFTSAYTAESVLILLKHPAGPGKGYVDDVQLTWLGEAPAVEIQEIMPLPQRVIEAEGGVAQLPDDKVQWYRDAKFGMFIHWGVYAAFDEGNEWVMHNQAYTPAAYRQRAEDPSNGFTADQFDPAAWAALAAQAGMRYVVLTARHHDGYALFHSEHPNAWTSTQHLGRDLILEYTDSVRASGLHVGLYYSPMSWRYPGYYNVTGNDMKPNRWGYEAAPWHHENARLMKEEVYEQVSRLLQNYGPIDYLFWDGAWLGQSINHPLEDRFWDTGKYQDPDGDWQIGEAYQERDHANGQPLGIMGMVRKYQPDILVNERFSWIGDVGVEEGGSATSGNVRGERMMEKCLSLMLGGWGYYPNRPVYSVEEVQVFLSDCVVRDINLLLNVAPDRHGNIPQEQQDVLIQTGEWLDKVGDAVYQTRGGPWQPQFGEFGYTWRSNKIYAHIYQGYRNAPEGTFTTQSLGARKVMGVKDIYTGQALRWQKNADHTVTIFDVDYSQSPSVTLLEITLADAVY